jgi:hypothetical protein
VVLSHLHRHRKLQIMEHGVWRTENLESGVYKLSLSLSPLEETRLCDPAVLLLHRVPSVAEWLKTPGALRGGEMMKGKTSRAVGTRGLVH